jgi:acetyl esterase/lipase
MNYRLAHGEQETGRHPHQVMDVANAIAFLIRCNTSSPLHLYVGGHSAGAHLTALVLCDPQFLRKAMEEYELDFKEVARNLRGFIGISGVYNLRRLAMSPLAEITIGPAFLGDEDVTLEASPVHALLRAHASQSDGLPPLATLPLLLLNAESDFHLRQDTSELEIALDQLSVSTKRQSVVISNRNHLSIMGEFGHGLISRDGLVDNPLVEHESWSLAYVLHQSQAAVSAASAYVTPFFMSDTTEPPDEASLRVLEFMRLIK